MLVLIFFLKTGSLLFERSLRVYFGDLERYLLDLEPERDSDLM